MVHTNPVYMNPLMDKLSASFYLSLHVYASLLTFFSVTFMQVHVIHIFFKWGKPIIGGIRRGFIFVAVNSYGSRIQNMIILLRLLTLNVHCSLIFFKMAKSTFYIWRNLWNLTLLGKPIILNWNYISTVFTFGVRLKQFPAFIRYAVSLLLTEKERW